jgi:hypothetical protein
MFWITGSFWGVPDVKMPDIGTQDKMSHVCNSRAFSYLNYGLRDYKVFCSV